MSEARLSRREVLLTWGKAAIGISGASALLTACSRSSPPAVSPAGTHGLPTTSTPESPANALDAFILSKMAIAHTPGLSVAVTKKDGTVWTKGYGWANQEANLAVDPDTVFMLASVSKTLTCAGVMKLVEQGKLDLDKDVGEYLPFPVRNPHYPKDPISTRMLLTHTSSIGGTTDGIFSDDRRYAVKGDSQIPLGDFLKGYLTVGGTYYVEGGSWLSTPPLGEWRYANMGVALAGYIAEVVSGIPFGDWVKEQICTPLGMDQSGFHLSDITTSNIAMPYSYLPNAFDPSKNPYVPVGQYGYPYYPAGSFRTSVAHLARWLQAFANFGELNGTRVLERSTVQEIRKVQYPKLAPWQGLCWFYAGRQNVSYPVGLEPKPYVFLGHGGGDTGVTTSMFLRTSDGVGVTMLANSMVDAGGKAAITAYQDIQDRVLSEKA